METTNASGGVGGMVVLWDNRVLELVGMEVDLFFDIVSVQKLQGWFLVDIYKSLWSYHEKMQRFILGGVRGHSWALE